MEVPFILDEIPIIIEASLGVATMPEHADNADTLLQRADIAMHRAKQMASGFAVYTPEFDRRSPERLGLMEELRDAIDGGQLLLHFQPQVEIATGRIVGVEALVRWQHPRLGLLAPDKFILAAEQTGLIGPLTRWVLMEALNHCHNARRQGIHLRVSVNLSARSLHDPHLLEMIEQALTATGTGPGLLTLEITESAIILDPQRAGETLAALSRMGALISIDDFGIGYTSLASIKHMSVNEIKIDKSFVLGMLTSNSDAMVVRSIIDLGHNLGLRVVAEGVETKEMLDAVAALGCDEAQGYFISRPQASEALKNWFTTAPWKLAPAG
jgi:EAL domain-containing protein (putative c-di-GMP-specific phosphodiesterase class I)